MLAESKSQVSSLWSRSWYVNNPKIVEFEGASGEHLDFFMLQKQKTPPSIFENLVKGGGKDYSFTCFACQIHLINFQNTLKHCKVFIKDCSHHIVNSFLAKSVAFHHLSTQTIWGKRWRKSKLTAKLFSKKWMSKWRPQLKWDFRLQRIVFFPNQTSLL